MDEPLASRLYTVALDQLPLAGNLLALCSSSTASGTGQQLGLASE